MLIYEALRKDHEKVKALLTELVALANDDEKRHEELIMQIRDELIPHARAEESVFYNCLRQLDAGKESVRHAYQEHLEAEYFLRTLQLRDKIDGDWKATAYKLKDALEHHIENEERKVFVVAESLLTQEEAEMMGNAFERIKPEVRGEGFMKTTLDMLVNMLPPRFSGSSRNFKPTEKAS